MRWITALVSFSLLIGMSVTEAKAQSVTITSVVSSKGSITAGGQATVPMGWSITSVELFAKPPKGGAGQGGYESTTPKNDGSYSATMKVPPAKYDIYALLTAQDPAGTTHYYYSATKANVDATGGS